MIIKAIKKLIPSKPFEELRKKMSPSSRALVDARFAETLSQMPVTKPSCTCTHHRHTSKGPKHFKSMRSPKHA